MFKLLIFKKGLWILISTFNADRFLNFLFFSTHNSNNNQKLLKNMTCGRNMLLNALYLPSQHI